jgi:Fusaric acid resistance protein family
MSDDANHTVRLLTEALAGIRRNRLQLILALRVTVAALSALALAQVLHLHLPLWAVLTSLIVTQMSLGRSVKVATDYLIGTFGGVAYGGALAILIPHESEWALLAVLALAVAPLAFIASFRANFNVLPVTAIIVLLVPSMQHVSPAASALDRVLEVSVGGAVGFVVSFLLFPSRAHEITIAAAANMLDLLAEALSKFLEDHTRELEQADRRRIHDGIAAALARLNASGAEAEHERSARLTSGPDTGPLQRTLLRLRHDIVMLSRAVGCELPEEVAGRLTEPLRNIEAAGSHYLRASATALRARKPPPKLDAVEAAFNRYIEEFGAVRQERLTRDMKSEVAERFFALGFALEQLREHLSEVHRVVGEWARD